jgi:hypothetical protein
VPFRDGLADSGGGSRALRRQMSSTFGALARGGSEATSQVAAITKGVMRLLLKSSFVEECLYELAKLLEPVLVTVQPTLDEFQQIFTILEVPYCLEDVVQNNYRCCLAGPEGAP